MSNGLLEVLRYFFLALLWLFFIYAARLVVVEVRRNKTESPAEETGNNFEGRLGLKLRIVEPEESRGRAFEIAGDITLGRSPACVIPLEGDTFASSVHARVYSRNGELWLEDLGSTNGTYLNNQRLSSPVRIRRGDHLKVGHTLLEVGR